MDVIHTAKSDSPGYTRYFLDEPVGATYGGLVAEGKLGDDDYTIVLHGQQVIDVPNEVKELKFGDKTLRLSKGN